MKYPVTVQAVRISKLGEFIADERVINNDTELENYRQKFPQYTIQIKKKHRRKNRFIHLLLTYWWAVVVLLLAVAILTIERGIFK